MGRHNTLEQGITYSNFLNIIQVQDVMDGELDGFIAAYLRTSVEGRKSKSSSGSDDSDI